VSERSEPKPSRLRQILRQRPEARTRLGRAVAALLGTALFTVGALGALLVWHLLRRGRLIRERLNPPRVVRMPGSADQELDDDGSARDVTASRAPQEP
jgi:hypothetical protein